MKTAAEVAAWRHALDEEFVDPSGPVCQLFFRWHALTDQRGEDLACFIAPDDARQTLGIWLGEEMPTVALEVRPEVLLNDAGEVEAFGTEQITPGVWSLKPSLNIPGFIHAFVVLYNVPEPAPWAVESAPRSRIIVPETYSERRVREFDAAEADLARTLRK